MLCILQVFLTPLLDKSGYNEREDLVMEKEKWYPWRISCKYPLDNEGPFLKAFLKLAQLYYDAKFFLREDFWRRLMGSYETSSFKIVSGPFYRRHWRTRKCLICRESMSPLYELCVTPRSDQDFAHREVRAPVPRYDRGRYYDGPLFSCCRGGHYFVQCYASSGDKSDSSYILFYTRQDPHPKEGGLALIKEVMFHWMGGRPFASVKRGKIAQVRAQLAKKVATQAKPSSQARAVVAVPPPDTNKCLLTATPISRGYIKTLGH